MADGSGSPGVWPSGYHPAFFLVTSRKRRDVTTPTARAALSGGAAVLPTRLRGRVVFSQVQRGESDP